MNNLDEFLVKSKTRYNDEFVSFKNDVIMGRSLQLYGEYCQPEIDLMVALLTPKWEQIKQAMPGLRSMRVVVYDIGANIGTHAAAFAHNGFDVYSFEPNPQSAAVFKMNTARYPNVKLYEHAVSDHDHEISIEQFDPKVPANYGEMHVNRGQHKCTARALDGMDLPAPDLIKIDVEGYELSVIRGCAHTIQKHHPTIFFEAHGSDVRDIVQLLTEWGYNLYWAPCKNYNPNNFSNNKNNVFGEGGVTNILAVYNQTVPNLTPCSIEQIKDRNPMANTVNVEVDIDYLRTTRLHIAIPCYGGMMTESTAMSLIKWANMCRQYDLHWTIETLVNESLINRARNTMVAKFLHMKEPTHLMFIDADIGFEPWHILVLMNHRVDVIGGLYPLKTMPLRWCVNGVENGEQYGPRLEVSKTGTGFMIIKREVFEGMKSHPAVKAYKNDIGLEPVYDQYLRTYFDTAVRQNRLYSEDWTFCENWRDLGGKIWVDTRVTLRHTGTFMFATEVDKQLEETYNQRWLAEKTKQGWTIRDSSGKDIELPPVKDTQ